MLKCSAQVPNGDKEVWAAIKNCHSARLSAGETKKRRDHQALAWMWTEVQDLVLDQINGNMNMRAQAKEIEHKILAGEISPTTVARILFNNYSPGVLTDGKVT